VGVPLSDDYPGSDHPSPGWIFSFGQALGLPGIVEPSVLSGVLSE